MKKVTGYKADDGTIFETIEECVDYEKKSEARLGLNDLFEEIEISDDDYAEEVVNKIIEVMLENYDKMTQIFIDFKVKDRIEKLHKENIELKGKINAN